MLCIAGQKTAYPLAELVYTKTGGNPFFLNEFLKSLYVEGLLKFEVKLGDWQWDLPSIQARGFTDNVVELMVGNIQQLPIETQQLLQLASCIGNQFDITTLARVAEQPLHETVVQLQHAVINGQLSIIDSQPVTEQKPVVTNELLITTHYRFTHDRIQQAAYSLIPQAQKQQVHHQIGQLLLQNTLPKEREQHIFAIVDQLNVGIAVIESQSEREQLAELNLIAGQKAKASTAYQPAFDYLNIGLGLLEEDSWQSQYKLMLALHLDGVEAAYLSGHFEQMEQLAQKVQQQTKIVLDKVKVYEVQIIAYAVQHKQTEAIKIALSAFKNVRYQVS
jgi:predicted ATPase